MKDCKTGKNGERFEEISCLCRMGPEEMAHLYRTDPEEFERRARAEIARVIENADLKKRARLHGLQFTIDAKLAHYTDPVARMNKMVELFWTGVKEFNDALHGRVRLPEDVSGENIVSFRHKK